MTSTPEAVIQLDRFRREATAIIGELETAVEISDLLVDRYYRNGLGDMEMYARRLQRAVVAARTLCRALTNDAVHRIDRGGEIVDPLGDLEDYPGAQQDAA